MGSFYPMVSIKHGGIHGPLQHGISPDKTWSLMIPCRALVWVGWMCPPLPLSRGPQWVGDQTTRPDRPEGIYSSCRKPDCAAASWCGLSANCTPLSGHRNIRWTDLNGRVQFGNLQRIVWPMWSTYKPGYSLLGRPVITIAMYPLQIYKQAVGRKWYNVAEGLGQIWMHKVLN